jgi:hypothetical protein
VVDLDFLYLVQDIWNTTLGRLAIVTLLVGVGLCSVGALTGCASITVPTADGDVVIKPGVRILAMCFNADGSLREIKVYHQSRVFAGQNALLGAAAGGVAGSLVGAPLPGAAVGGSAGLVTDVVAAAQDLIGTALDPVPSCEPTVTAPASEDAAELTPAEDAMPPISFLDPALELERPLGPGAFLCGGLFPPDGCP